VAIGSVAVGLNTSGGVLVLGLVCGWLRSVYPVFGCIPEPTQAVLESVGLHTFIAVVGLSVGPSFVAGLLHMGPGLFCAGIIVVLVPHTVTLCIGYYCLQQHPGVLLGVCAGGSITMAALRAIEAEADSKVPLLGYTVPYALGNALLPVRGPVAVALVS